MDENNNNSLEEVMANISNQMQQPGAEAQGVTDTTQNTQGQTIPPEQQVPPEQSAPAEQPIPQSAPTAPTDAITLAQNMGRIEQENAFLKLQLLQFQQAQQQQSQAAEEQITQEVLEPPILDMSDFQYLSDDERNQRQTEYANKMLEYVAANVNKTLKPVVDTATSQRQAAEEAAALEDLRTKASDIDTYQAGMNAFLSSNNKIADALKALPPREKYVTAYLIMKGSQPQQNQTTEEIAKTAMSNPEVMKRIMQEQATAVNNTAGNIPPVTASSGIANVPAPITNVPTSLNDVFESIDRDLKNTRN